MFLFWPLDDFVIFVVSTATQPKKQNYFSMFLREDKFVFHNNFNNTV